MQIKYQCIYLFQSTIGKKKDFFPIKIGVSSLPHRRLQEINGSNPYPVIMIWASRDFHPNHAVNIERALHKFFTSRNSHIHNEWFELSHAQIEWILDIFSNETDAEKIIKSIDDFQDMTINDHLRHMMSFKKSTDLVGSPAH